jgi:hypothetical protein
MPPYSHNRAALSLLRASRIKAYAQEPSREDGAVSLRAYQYGSSLNPFPTTGKPCKYRAGQWVTSKGPRLGLFV